MARISETILLFLLNAAWQATLVALLVSASDRLLRRAASRSRHMLWVVALVTCVAFTLSGPLHVSPAPSWLPFRASVDLKEEWLQEPLTLDPPLERAQGAVHPVSSRGNLPGMAMPIVALSQPLALVITAFYGLLLLYRVGVLLKAGRRTRTVLRSAQRIELSPQAAQVLACCRRAFGLGQVSLLSSPAVAVPLTARVMRPVVILPERLLRDGDIHLLTCALGHETAHIARHDYLLNLVYELVSLPLWFHPAIRLVLRRIRQTREMRCDEIVTERLLEPGIYARSLVQLAGAALPFGRPAATITVGIADADILEERIMSILKYSPAKLGRRSALLFIAASLFVVPCIALTPLAVRVTIRQPAVAAVPGQAGAETPAPASQSSQIPARTSETMKILTSQGEVVVTTDRRPKVGDVLPVDGRGLRIIAIDRNGQYHASFLKGDAASPLAVKEYVNSRVDFELSAQIQEARQNVERAERAAAEKHEGNLSTQDLEAQKQPPQPPQPPPNGGGGGDQLREARRQMQRAERAWTEKHEGEWSPQELEAQRQQLGEARQQMERAERAWTEKHEGEWSPQELEARRRMEVAGRAERAQRQPELTRQAKIPIDQAIQIAKRQAPGTVVEARLFGERSTVNYLISILQENPNGSETVHVVVNAVDGSILETGTRK